MTQIKILVNLIDDVVHRAAFEAEANVYLKTGWKIIATHQHLTKDSNLLSLTTILEKEAEAEAEESENQDVKQATVKKEVAKESIKEKDGHEKSEADKANASNAEEIEKEPKIEEEASDEDQEKNKSGGL